MPLDAIRIPASPALRSALKRGRAREVVAHARAAEADHAAIVAEARDLRPNRKALERSVARLRRRPGVVWAAILQGDRLAVVTRNTREVITRSEAVEVFRETAVLYTRMTIRPDRDGASFGLMRASFCLHALERLVERSPVPVQEPLLPVLDSEAVALLRRLSRSEGFHDAGDCFLHAGVPGLWAGSLDLSTLEPDWGLAYDSAAARLPLYSVRTFLGPEEMRPTVWAKWRDDPAIRVG